MVLYHFCAAHMIPSIMKHGLTLGQWPRIGELHKNWPKCQWLTKDPNPKNQSWATRRLVSYSRTAYRLTVKIPDSHHRKCVKATDYIKDLPDYEHSLITEWDGSENWYVYTGNIPPKWIVGCRKMEG